LNCAVPPTGRSSRCVKIRDTTESVQTAETMGARVGRTRATLALALFAGVVLGSQGLSAVLIYDRELLARGQLWRAWTGHVVHYGSSHLLWDLVVLVPAGCWLESRWPKAARRFYLACPLVISAVLFVFDPELVRYAGLSGLATGVLVLLAGSHLGSRDDGRRWLWVGVLVLVTAKLAHEFISGAPLVVSDLGGNVRSVPLAHLVGAVCGIAFTIALRATRPAGA
jgi:rhomboid family GlyGly-CTERM serine protease